MKTPTDCIETLLLIAINKRMAIRDGIDNREERQKNIMYLCERLDALSVPWTIQNAALMFINDVDTDKVWKCLHRLQLKDIAERIVGGERFNQIIE